MIVSEAILNQVYFNASSAEGLSLGLYLSAYCKSFNIAHSSFAILLGLCCLNRFSSGPKQLIPGGPLIMVLINSPLSRKYFDDLNHCKVRSLGIGPKKSVIYSKWPSSQLYMFATGKSGVPVRSSYTRQPNLQISILWLKGAFRISSEARKPIVVTGFFDTLSDLQVKLWFKPILQSNQSTIG